MRHSILVVDDQLAMRRMFQAIFVDSKWDVELAEDGVIAYKAATAKRYDLVITDFHMPNMDGIQLTEKLRALSSYRGVPILVVSTEGNKEKKGLGKAAGANGWMVKPIKAEILLPAVEKLIG